MDSFPIKHVAVIGAGSWGTALAQVLVEAGVSVCLWGNDPEAINSMAETHCNTRYFPDIVLPAALSFSNDLSTALADVDTVLFAVPSHVFRQVLLRVKPFLSDRVRLIWATKGLEEQTNQLLSTVITDVLGERTMAFIAGPSFAKEVIVHQPTAISIACDNHDFAVLCQNAFHSRALRVYIHTDVVGAQICAALKNVLAIATGLSDGMGLGNNARAAIISRGLQEMIRLTQSMGGQLETVMGLSGVGDLVLTATGDASRNRRLGLALGAGKSIEEAAASIGQAIEGMTNTQQFSVLAKAHGVDMPIVDQVHAVLFEKRTAKDAMQKLLNRSPKPAA